MISDSASTVNARERLRRILEQKQRKPTKAELINLQNLLKRASPDFTASNRSWHIGMNALTLTRENMSALRPSNLMFHKVDGIGVLAAFFPLTGEERSLCTMLCIRKNGTVAIDNVPLAYNGRVLMDGELCLRRSLSQTESTRISGTISCIVGFKYLDVDDGNPDDDSKYELCFAAHDLLVADDARSSSARSRFGDAICVQNATARLERLMAITQSQPSGDAREAQFKSIVESFSERKPALTVFFKTPYLASMARLAFRTLPTCLRGVRLDGMIFLPNDTPYMVGKINPRLLKYKSWYENTGDFVLVKDDASEVYNFFVVNNESRARCISNRIYWGHSEQERAHTRSLVELEAKRLAAGGEKNTPLIFECEPYLDDSEKEAFYALRNSTNKEQMLLDAYKLLQWRPIMHRYEKLYPNSEVNYWTIVKCLLDYITDADIIAHLGGK